MLALAGWYGGAAVCANATQHRVVLGQTVALLKLLEEEIAFRRTSLNALYLRLAAENAFASLGFVPPSQTGQVAAHNTPLFQSLPIPPRLHGEERTAFAACFARLGYTGAQQECERLVRYRKQFEAFYQQAIAAERAALAIDRKIGLALGSMVALALV